MMTMIGSGWHSFWTDVQAECKCGFDGQVEASTNDNGNIYFTCPNCKEEQELEKPF